MHSHSECYAPTSKLACFRYADIDNPVFYKENTMMLLGDAKETCTGIASELKKALAK